MNLIFMFKIEINESTYLSIKYNVFQQKLNSIDVYMY